MQTIKNTHNRFYFQICLVAFLVCLFSAAIFLFNVLNTQKKEALLTLDAMQLEAKEEAAELASSLRALEPLVEQIAADLSVGKLTVSEIIVLTMTIPIRSTAGIAGPCWRVVTGTSPFIAGRLKPWLQSTACLSGCRVKQKGSMQPVAWFLAIFR